MASERIGIIGAGILGIALARHIALNRPGSQVVVLEKEPRVAAHQTGRNSGVVHAGVYYRPGSLKAVLCRRGVALLREYCTDRALPYVEVGKVLVAQNRQDAERLEEIARRARANEVPGVTRLGPEGLRDVEPRVRGVAGLHSPSTAITDFVQVAESFAKDLRDAGGAVHLDTRVVDLRQDSAGVDVLTTDAGGGDPLRWRFDRLISCAGLHSDRIADLAGAAPEPRIVAFRGDYRELSRPELVRGLVYPVPDPRYPFLGVHLTRHVHGEVMAGPNAVLASAREGYHWAGLSARDLAETLGRRPFWRLARRHWRAGVREAVVSMSRTAFAREVRRLLPEVEPGDLRAAPSGVRAQALGADGGLVDDFVIDDHGLIVLVRNAPSPAATSSLAIAEHLYGRVFGAG